MNSKEKRGLVSIVVPIYNGEAYLEKCIKSIINQTYDNFELILVDDGSTDNTYNLGKMIATKDDRISIFHYENGGVSCARNEGISHINGEYFTFVDVDDELEPSALEKAIFSLESSKSNVIIYGWNVQLENSVESIKICDEIQVYKSNEIVLQRILQNYSDFGGGYPWNKLWKRQGLLDIELFDIKLSYFEDLEWSVRMLQKTDRIVLCPECLYKYNVNPNGATQNPKRKEKNELEYHKAIHSIIKTLSENTSIGDWFKEKYAQELPNGIVHAKRMKWRTVENYLSSKLCEFTNTIMKSKKIPLKTKIRFGILLLKEKMMR